MKHLFPLLTLLFLVGSTQACTVYATTSPAHRAAYTERHVVHHHAPPRVVVVPTYVPARACVYVTMGREFPSYRSAERYLHRRHRHHNGCHHPPIRRHC